MLICMWKIMLTDLHIHVLIYYATSDVLETVCTYFFGRVGYIMGVSSLPLVKKYGYDVQVYLYCELFNKPYEEFKFIAVDKSSCDIGIYDVSEGFYNQGKAKVLQALETFETFFVHGADLDSYCIKGTL